MRFMMLMIPQNYGSAAADATPDAAAVAEMMKYNEQLGRAGILLALDGLTPPAQGARVRWKDGKATVTDGPFAEAKEAIGGFWIIQVKSREEAIEWARRIPVTDDSVVEVRRVFDMSDFDADVQAEVDSLHKRLEADGIKPL